MAGTFGAGSERPPAKGGKSALVAVGVPIAAGGWDSPDLPHLPALDVHAFKHRVPQAQPSLAPATSDTVLAADAEAHTLMEEFAQMDSSQVKIQRVRTSKIGVRPEI